MKMTKTQQLIYALQQQRPGIKEITNTSHKYRTFQTIDGKLYFIGKAAALRTGRNASTSVSLEPLVNNLIKKYPHPENNS